MKAKAFLVKVKAFLVKVRAFLVKAVVFRKLQYLCISFHFIDTRFR